MRGNTTLTPSSTGNNEVGQEAQRPDMRPRTATQLPPPTAGTPYRTFQSSNDGVFANLNAKPERGGEKEELPPVSPPNHPSVFPSILTSISLTDLRTSRRRRHPPLLGRQHSPHPRRSLYRRSFLRRPRCRFSILFRLERPYLAILPTRRFLTHLPPTYHPRGKTWFESRVGDHPCAMGVWDACKREEGEQWQ